MLQGSLQTVALAEVLQFLESTAKTGKLHVTGAGGEGRLWFDEGLLSGFDTRSSREPAEAIFELMAISDGDFVFTSTDGARPEDPTKVARREVGPLLVEAKALCEEWSAILGVVPALDRRVELVGDAPSDPVTIGRDHWAAIVAVGSGRTVQEVIARRDVSDIAGCRVIRALVEAGLASICEPPLLPEPVVATTAARSELTPSSTGETTEPPTTSEYQLNGNAESANGHSEPAQESASANGNHDGPSRTVGGILGFDFGSLIAEFPVPAATASEADGPDEDGFSIARYASESGSDIGINVASSLLRDVEPGPSGSSAEDHYAALRAAMLEVGENLDQSDAASWDEQAEVKRTYEVDTNGIDASQAGMPLHSLINEVSSLLGDAGASDMRNHEAAEDPAGRVDALADRGPWSEQELADIHEQGMWDDVANSQSPADTEGSFQTAVVDGESADTTYAAEDSEDDFEPSAEEPAEEPINRGLLLKFLSSVRN